MGVKEGQKEGFQKTHRKKKVRIVICFKRNAPWRVLIRVDRVFAILTISSQEVQGVWQGRNIGTLLFISALLINENTENIHKEDEGGERDGSRLDSRLAPGSGTEKRSLPGGGPGRVFSPPPGMPLRRRDSGVRRVVCRVRPRKIVKARRPVMSCSACGGCIAPSKEFDDYGPKTIRKCLNCGRGQEGSPKPPDPSADHGKIRHRDLQEALNPGRSTTRPDDPKEDRIGNTEEEVSMGQKTPDNLAVVRRERLKILTDRFGGAFRTAKKYPELHGVSLSNVMKGKYAMGETQSRKVERIMGLPEGWMDDPSAELPESFGPAFPEDPQVPSAKNPPPGEKKALFVCRIPENIQEPQETDTLRIQAGPSLAGEILAVLASHPRVARIEIVTLTLSEAR